MEEKYRKFLETEFVVFDLETSGLDPVKDEVLELAALKLKGREIADRFERLIQPTRAISAEAERIHGLNEIFLLVNGRNSHEAFKDFLDFSSQAIIVGHNIKEFDWLFILNHFKKTARPEPGNKLIDTLELSRQLLKLPTYNLAGVAKHFGLEHANAHRAMPDVEVNAQVFLFLMDLLLGQKNGVSQ